ncbi:MAG TPA: hypothetical protein VFT95_14925, partial [Micromonosporaceae bacterium]|nr:hypothetical protein [Micromonosporaceae bacterium]
MGLLFNLSHEALTAIEPVVDAIEAHAPVCFHRQPIDPLAIVPAHMVAEKGHVDAYDAERIARRFIDRACNDITNLVLRRNSFDARRYRTSIGHAHDALVFMETMSKTWLDTAMWPGILHPLAVGPLYDPWVDSLLSMRGVAPPVAWAEAK